MGLTTEHGGRGPKVFVPGTIIEKENRVLSENYRPITFIAIPCTLFEHILVSRILDHLNKDNNASRQHGVRKGMSCYTQLIEEMYDDGDHESG